MALNSQPGLAPCCPSLRVAGPQVSQKLDPWQVQGLWHFTDQAAKVVKPPFHFIAKYIY